MQVIALAQVEIKIQFVISLVFVLDALFFVNLEQRHITALRSIAVSVQILALSDNYDEVQIKHQENKVDHDDACVLKYFLPVYVNLVIVFSRQLYSFVEEVLLVFVGGSALDVGFYILE